MIPLIIIVLITAALLLGFFLGVRSKAVSKRKEIKKEREQVQSIKEAVYEAPPPPQNKEVEYRHVAPSFYSSYKKNTFVETNKCKNCNTIAYECDMWRFEPCPSCGGVVKPYSVCKWEGGKWVESSVR